MLTKKATASEPASSAAAPVSSEVGLSTTKKKNTKIEPIELKKGDTIDFVVDYNANLNNDDFVWVPTLKITEPSTANSGGDYVTEWNGRKEFSGPPEPPAQPLDAWEKYAQVLLLSNEFIFVD